MPSSTPFGSGCIRDGTGGFQSGDGRGEPGCHIYILESEPGFHIYILESGRAE
jgi:hypothetical protein